MARLIRYLEDGIWKYASVKDVGALEALLTNDKTDIVSAINELVTNGNATKQEVITLEGLTNDLNTKIENTIIDVAKKADLTYVDGQLVKKIDTTKYDTEYNQVKTDLLNKVDLGKHQTDYDAITTELATKVEQLDFDGLKGRVTTVETEVVNIEGELSQKITKTEFDDAVGVNKWIASKYSVTGTDFSTTPPKFSLISGLKPVETKEIDDASTLNAFTGDNFVVHYFTNVYMNIAKTITLNVTNDDGMTVYMNGAEISSRGTTSTAYSISLSLREGWNTIEILHGEYTGSELVNLGVAVSTLVDKLTCHIGIGDKNDTRLSQAETSIKQTSDAITLKADKTEVASLGNRVSNAEATLTVHSDEIASKVAQTEFNAYSQRLSSAESTITQHSNEIATKVAQTDYDLLNGRVTNAESTITQHTDEIALKVAKTDHDALAGRVSSAETSITSNTNAISLKANQTALDTTNGRLTTAEGQLTVHSDQIATKVSQTDFNALETRMDTAETSITQNANAITLKASQTDLNALDGRLDSAEATLTVHANEIATKVASTDVYLKTDMDGKLAGKTDDAEFNALVTRVSTAETSITQNSNSISLKANQSSLDTTNSNVTNAQNSANTAQELARAMATGRMMYADPVFKLGMNGVGTYNNSANGTVTVTRVTKPTDAPTVSTHVLEIKTTGTASPNWGGFYFGTQTRASAVLITRIIAKIPVGRNIAWHSNLIGNSSSHKWLTSTAGTGKYEEYICKVTCGADGTFSTTNYFTVSGGTADTTNPLIWHVAYATVFDVTDNDYTLSDLANDDKLTPVEKTQLKKEWDVIVAEKPTIEATATTYGITTEKTSYVNSYNALSTYLSPLLSNLSTTSDIVGTTFRANFDDYYDKKALLNKKINEDSRTLANNAQSTANTANSTANTLRDTTIPALTTRVSEAEAEINIQSEEISLRVTKTEFEQLQIGGRNIFRYSGNFGVTIPSAWWANNGGGLTVDTVNKYNGYNTLKTTVGTGITGTWYKLENNVEYTYSVMMKADQAFTGTGNTPIHYHAGLNNTSQSKITVTKFDTSYLASDVGKYKLLYITFKLTSDADSFRPFVYFGTGTTVMNIAYLKLERGNKPTDYTSSEEEVAQRFTSAETRITQTEEDITLRATKTEVTNAVADVKVGGTNLVTNSTGKFANDIGDAIGWSAGTTAEIIDGKNALEVKTSSASEMMKSSERITVKPNTTYAVRFLVKGTANAKGYDVFFLGRKANSTSTTDYDYIYKNVESGVVAPPTNKFEERFFTLTTKSDEIDGYIRIDNNGSSDGLEAIVWFSEIKMEEGNKHTAWSSSEKDVTDKVVELNTRVSNAEILLESDKIVSTVTNHPNFDLLMQGKVDTGTLSGYATTGSVDNLKTSIDTLEGKVNALPTNIATESYVTQTSESVTTDFIKASNGTNLVKNSVGFAGFEFWSVTNSAYIDTIQDDPDLEKLGFGSGFKSLTHTATKYLDQFLDVEVGKTYTVACMINKPSTSATSNEWATVEVFDGEVDQSTTSRLSAIGVGSGAKTNGYQSFDGQFTPTQTRIRVRITFGATAVATTTGVIVHLGSVPLQWSMARGEIYNTAVKMDMKGIRVSRIVSGKETHFTTMTPDKFAGYYDLNGDGIIDTTTGSADEVFRMDDDAFLMKNAIVKDTIEMGGIKVIQINTTASKGWAFVPVS